MNCRYESPSPGLVWFGLDRIIYINPKKSCGLTYHQIKDDLFDIQASLKLCELLSGINATEVHVYKKK